MRVSTSLTFAFVFCLASLCAFVGSDVRAQPAQPPALTAAKVDSFIKANKDVSAVEAKMPESGKPDAKLQADLDNAAKKGGFANYDEYSNIGGAISMVMEGIDPETKKFVGATEVIKKQIAAVQADKAMSAKDKKEALGELNQALKSAGSPPPPPANVDLVVQNYDKLSALVEQD